MKRIAGWCLFLSACILFPNLDGMTAVLAGGPFPVILVGERPGLLAEEGSRRWVGKPHEPIQMAAGRTRKTTGRAKGAGSRKAPVLSPSQDAPTGGQYASWELDSLLQALKPMKEVKKDGMNARSLQARTPSSSKGREKGGPTALWFKVGLEYSARNEYDNAIAADPRDGSSYYNRAVIRQKSGRYESAIDDYTRAAGLIPSDADIYYNRALAYQCLGNIQAAIEDYSRAIRLNPDDPEAYWNRGLAFSRQGREDLASTDYCSSMDLAPARRASPRKRNDI